MFKFVNFVHKVQISWVLLTVFDFVTYNGLRGELGSRWILYMKNRRLETRDTIF